MGQQNIARDREIFIEFASVTGLKLCHGQVDTPDPPQPDVVAMIEGVGRVAYELGEIIDQDLARNYSLSDDTVAAIREYHEAMPPECRVIFDQRYSNAFIMFCFSNAANARKRRQKLPAIFDWLCSSVVPESDRPQLAETGVADVLDYVRIHATTPGAGPTFCASRPSCFDPSAQSILEKKFKKGYDTSFPLELILHSDRRTIYAAEAWLAKFSAFAMQGLSKSPFRRIWIFERYPPTILYVYPLVSLHEFGIN